MGTGGVARDLFLQWLKHASGRPAGVPSGEGFASTLVAGDTSMALEVHELPFWENPRWDAQRVLLQDLMGENLPLRVVLWVPPGAQLPQDEPALGEFVRLAREAAIRLGPHERSHVELSIALKIRKTSEAGSVVSTTGGLNPHWAKFTDRVQGSFDLDSTALHRLPESDEYLEGLIERIVGRTNAMSVSEIAQIEASDCWTLQSLDGDPGVTIAGIPADAAQDMGLAVRRDFRRLLKDAAPRLREREATMEALVILCHYANIAQEGVSTAMRGYDPALYGGIDLICLVSDGLVKPLVQPAAKTLADL